MDTVLLPTNGLDLKTFLFDIETRMIQQALDQTGQNRTHAAKLLGMNRTTLVMKMRLRGWIARRDEEKVVENAG